MKEKKRTVGEVAKEWGPKGKHGRKGRQRREKGTEREKEWEAKGPAPHHFRDLFSLPVKTHIRITLRPFLLFNYPL